MNTAKQEAYRMVMKILVAYFALKPARRRQIAMVGGSVLVVLLVVFVYTSVVGNTSTPDLVGNWQADDRTGMKVIRPNGACSGMYYSHGRPLDIGGGMSCSLSSNEGSNGRYTLVVSQPPNQATFAVAFDGNDSATVYDAAGTRLFSMDRR